MLFFLIVSRRNFVSLNLIIFSFVYKIKGCDINWIQLTDKKICEFIVTPNVAKHALVRFNCLYLSPFCFVSSNPHRNRKKRVILGHPEWISITACRLSDCAIYLFSHFFALAAIIRNIISKLTKIWPKHWAWIRNCCIHHMLPLAWMVIWLALAVWNNIWTKPAHWVWRTLKKTMCDTMLRRTKVVHSTASAFVILMK